jgi:hypothetical protein
MTEMIEYNPYPVAIGGVGGSGTRIIAVFLQMLGYYLGDDLNEAMDNLWFTLLFKRRSVLVESETDFCSLVSLFISRMSGRTDISEQERSRVFRLAQEERIQHSPDWLTERAYSFSNGRTSKHLSQSWCWKEPNTHIVIERILACQSDLRYIHVVRHPLDMAVSGNQNQLLNWGPIFLSRDVIVEPRLSLSYWCAAHRRVAKLMRYWPGRAMVIDFDALCAAPGPNCEEIAKFLGAKLSNETLASFSNFVHRPESAGRFSSLDLGQFNASDLAYVAEIGYTL